MGNISEHWNKVYKDTEIEKTGWYEEEAVESLKLIKSCNLKSDSVILDVGSGASTLISSLLELGYSNIIVNDISKTALEKAKEKIGSTSKVKWIVDDITKPIILKLNNEFDLWHDRTVLHFLTEEKSRIGYLKTLNSILKIGGYAIIAVFSLKGAKKCSGLRVRQYNSTMLKELLGEKYRLLKAFEIVYTQPSGGKRPFIYSLFKRIS